MGHALGFQITQITITTTTNSILLNGTVIYQKAHDPLSLAVQESGWEAGGCKKRQIEQLLQATFSSMLLFAFCSRSAANVLTPAWKMSWGNSIYEHVISPAATNVFPLGPYLNLTQTDSCCSRVRHYYPAASEHHLFPFGTRCSIIAPTPTRQFMKLRFYHIPPVFLRC